MKKLSIIAIILIVGMNIEFAHAESVKVPSGAKRSFKARQKGRFTNEKETITLKEGVQIITEYKLTKNEYRNDQSSCSITFKYKGKTVASASGIFNPDFQSCPVLADEEGTRTVYQDYKERGVTGGLYFNGKKQKLDEYGVAVEEIVEAILTGKKISEIIEDAESLSSDLQNQVGRLENLNRNLDLLSEEMDDLTADHDRNNIPEKTSADSSHIPLRTADGVVVR